MVPMLEALADNPEAAQDFFAPEAKVEDFAKPDESGLERVDYFVTDREWYVDPEVGGPVAASERDYVPGAIDPDDPKLAEKLDTPGFDALGNALGAATVEAPDNKAASQIMGETVHQLGSPNGRNGMVPASMRDSMGDMLSDHIGSVNQSLIPGGPTLEPDGPRYRPSTEALVGKEGGYDPLFRPEELSRVMRGTAYDPDAYVDMYQAQQEYATERMKQAAGNGPGTVQDAAVDSARVFGELDQGRVDAIRQEHVRSMQAYNEAIAKIDTAVSATVGQIPYVGAPLDQATSAVVEDAQRHSSGMTDEQIAELHRESREQLQRQAERVMWNNGQWDHSVDPSQRPDPALLHDDGTPIEFSRVNPQNPPPMKQPPPSELGPGHRYQSVEEWRAAKERYVEYAEFTQKGGYAPIENTLQAIDQGYSEGKVQSEEAAGGNMGKAGGG